MSLKSNALVTAVAAALGVVVAAGTKPVCEGLLNDYAVSTFGVAEVDASGRCMVIVSIDTGAGAVVRPVADSLGNVRLFSSADGAVGLAKRTQMPSNVAVQYRRFLSAGTVGDPVAALKTKYRAAKAEELAAGVQKTKLAQKLAAAVSLGWDTSTGTPENNEYVDLQDRAASILEWESKVGERKTALGAALTAAGVNLATLN